MKNIRAAILAACLGALASISAHAQNIAETHYGTDADVSCSYCEYDAAFGYGAMQSSVYGSYSTAVGYQAIGGSDNNPLYVTAVGYEASYSGGEEDVAIGYQALYAVATGGVQDTAIGNYSLNSDTSGWQNTAVGESTLTDDSTGSQNTATGDSAMAFTTTGSYNTAVGFDALLLNTTGSHNIGIGTSAGYNNPAGSSYNIDIGNQGTSSDSGTIRIGTSSNETAFYAAGIDGVTISSGVPVYINSSGQLGTVNSSIRFKEDVHDMGDVSSRIFQLRPVTYRYKQAYADGSKPIDYGLIAEEVAKVYPDLVVKGTDGQIQTVQYQKLTPMLLNELQKQHQIIAEQGEAIRELKEQQSTAIQVLEKRLAALEAAQTTNGLTTHAAE